VFRIALDQNFPIGLVRSITGAVPSSIALKSIYEVDPRLSDLGDRQLIIALHQLGFDVMVSNDHRILNVPEELAALLATKLDFVCVRSMANSSIKATGALLLELTNLPRVFQDKRRRVLELQYEPRRPSDPWEYMQRIAQRARTSAETLYATVKPNEEELAQEILSR
jgi:hypothetical protein